MIGSSDCGMGCVICPVGGRGCIGDGEVVAMRIRMNNGDTKRIMMQEAQQYCDDNDKSTEFMLQYMQDMAGATLDEVLDYLQEKHDES